MISVVYNDGKSDYYLDDLVKSVTWSGDIKQASRKLQIEMNNTLNGRTRAVTLEKGKEIRFLNDGSELFRGVIFGDKINAKGQTTITAYDENIYLTKNEDTKKFVNEKASTIIKELCAEYGISAGTISDTGYVIPKLILRDKTLWEMMITALTVTQEQTGKWFFITCQNGSLQLLERKTQAVKWVLENGTNIIDASYSHSIEDLKSQVKVIAGDDDKKELIAVVKNDDLVSKFGLMQHLERADSDMNQSQIEQLAKQLLKDLGTINDEATIDAIGISEVYSGKSVYVIESMTGIIGSYYVSSDFHTFENGSHTMNLTLSFTDDLPKMKYDAPKEPATTTTPKRKKPKKPKKITGNATLSSVLDQIDKMGE